MLKLGFYWITYLQWLALIPIYVCLAPLCMISSALFDWIMSWIAQEQSLTLLIILIGQWAISAFIICQLVINRTFKAIFFYEFVFFLMFSNCALIGITYSLLKRYNFIEQLAAKIFTTLLLVFFAQKIKINFRQIDSQCDICLSKIDQNYIVLKCAHFFHQECLWNWFNIKEECPRCKKHIY